MELFLFVNVSIVITVALALYFTFPKRLSELLRANRFRLDGTLSQRRAAIESRSLRNWFTNVIFFGMLSLALINTGLVVCHHFIMPLPIALEGLERFNLNPDTWKDNLRDSSKGNLVEELRQWSRNQGRDNLSGRVMPVYYLLYTFGVLALIAYVFTLGRWYVRSLVQLANRAKQRKQNYLVKDMETRLEAVEDAINADHGAS